SKNTVAASPLASKTNAGIIRETPKESELPDLKGAGNSQDSSPSLSTDFSKRWLPDRRVEITLLGPCGNKWPVQYLGDRPNPGLSGGWKGFAIDKNLEEGDICVFELENKENCILKVHIYRVVGDCTPPRKVEGVKRKHEESEKKSVPVKKLPKKKRDTADTNKEKESPKSTTNSGIKTEPQQVEANQGSPSVTSDALKTASKIEM
ncbi:hypothetical protein KI387_011571, partial [Taxus chinensis]